ncbi:hypothetical protein XENTR_v10017476 [Xenopus tropicalis]|nr:hypothetical protein XENTR_v10017476 [Xenopus tropicalis]
MACGPWIQEKRSQVPPRSFRPDLPPTLGNQSLCPPGSVCRGQFLQQTPTLWNYQAYFGQGTILTVLEKGQERLEPKVSIFRPDPQELSAHGYLSLVCVASGFFPEHVELSWLVNGNPREGSRGKAWRVGETYSMSSRLSLTKEQYYNTENSFQCSAGFRGESKVATDSVSGEKDCGVSPDELKRLVNNGVLSYILILCKSALYGLIVTAVIWRKKASASSY